MARGDRARLLDERSIARLVTPRVLLTDAQERAVLAAARCLEAAGYEVTAVGNHWSAPGLWSRAANARRLAPDSSQQVEKFIAGLEEAVRAEGTDILLPGTDTSLFAISRHRDRFTPEVRLGLPSHEVVESVLNRADVADAAREAGLVPPQERLCTGPSEALAAARAFGYPVLAKPVKTVVEQHGSVERRASVLARDGRTLREVAGSFGACIVQRRVQGRLLSFGGAATDHGLLAFVVSRYERTWPPLAGSACYAQTVPCPAGLTEKVQTLLSALSWRGLFQLELIERDADDFATIDFNPRLYGSIPLAAAAGVPLASLWCAWLLGERPARGLGAHIGVRFRWEDADLSNIVWQLSQGDTRGALSSARPRRGVTHAYFQLRDPGPSAARAIQIVRKGFTKARR